MIVRWIAIPASFEQIDASSARLSLRVVAEFEPDQSEVVRVEGKDPEVRPFTPAVRAALIDWPAKAKAAFEKTKDGKPLFALRIWRFPESVGRADGSSILERPPVVVGGELLDVWLPPSSQIWRELAFAGSDVRDPCAGAATAATAVAAGAKADPARNLLNSASIDRGRVAGRPTTYSSAAMARNTRDVAVQLAALQELAGDRHNDKEPATTSRRVSVAVQADVLAPYRWIEHPTVVKLQAPENARDVPRATAPVSVAVSKDAVSISAGAVRGSPAFGEVLDRLRRPVEVKRWRETFGDPAAGYAASARPETVRPGDTKATNPLAARDEAVLTRERRDRSRSLNDRAKHLVRTQLRASGVGPTPPWMVESAGFAARVGAVPASRPEMLLSGHGQELLTALEYGLFADEATASAWEHAEKGALPAAKARGVDLPAAAPPANSQDEVKAFLAATGLARGEEWLGLLAGTVFKVQATIGGSALDAVLSRSVALELWWEEQPLAELSFQSCAVPTRISFEDGRYDCTPLPRVPDGGESLPMLGGFLALQKLVPDVAHVGPVPAFSVEQQDLDSASQWLARAANDERRAGRIAAVFAEGTARPLWSSLLARNVDGDLKSALAELGLSFASTPLVGGAVRDSDASRDHVVVDPHAEEESRSLHLRLRGEGISLLWHGRGRREASAEPSNPPHQGGDRPPLRFAEDLACGLLPEIEQFSHADGAPRRIWKRPGARIEDYSRWGLPPKESAACVALARSVVSDGEEPAGTKRLIPRQDELVFRYDAQAIGAPPSGTDVDAGLKGGARPSANRLACMTVKPGMLPGLLFSPRSAPIEYRVRARVVDISGGRWGGDPPSAPMLPTRLRRYEKVPAPRILLDAAHATYPEPREPTRDGKTLQRVRPLFALAIDGAEPARAVDRRWVVPAPVTLQLLALHGIVGSGDRSPWSVGTLRGVELTTCAHPPRINGLSGVPAPDACPLPCQSSEGEVEVFQPRSGAPPMFRPDVSPYLPDPCAELLKYRITAIEGLEREWHTVEDTVPVEVYASGDSWPRASAVEVRLVAAPKGAAPISAKWRASERALVVALAPGWRAEMTLRHVPRDLGEHFVYLDDEFDHVYRDARLLLDDLVSEDAQKRLLRKTLADCTNEQIAMILATSPTSLSLAHGVRRPSSHPVALTDPEPKADERAENETAIRLTMTLKFSTMLFQQAIPIAVWNDPTDDIDAPRPAEERRTLALKPFSALEIVASRETTHLHDAVADFGDCKHRVVRLAAQGVPRAVEGPASEAPAREKASDVKVADDAPRVHVLATRAPGPPVPVIGVPGGATECGVRTLRGEDAWEVYAKRRRGRVLRVYFARGWYDSGAGERVALILAASGLKLDAKEPGAQSLSQWGGEPAFRRTTPRRWLTIDELVLGDAWTLSAAALPDVGNLPRDKYVVAFTDVRYCENTSLWYVDLEFTHPHAELAFVNLSFARYQPHALQPTDERPETPDRRLSSTRSIGFLQALFDRELVVTRDPAGKCGEDLIVAVLGERLSTDATPPGNVSHEFRVELLMKAYWGDLFIGWTQDCDARAEAVDLPRVSESVLAAWRVRSRDVSGDRRLVVYERQVFGSGNPERPKRVSERIVYADAVEV